MLPVKRSGKKVFLGKVNINLKDMPVINIAAQDLRQKLKTNPESLEIIDVREPEEYKQVHVKGSKLIPMGELNDRIDEINWDKEVVFLCRSGARSAMMANLISAMGHEVENLAYGILECQQGTGEFLESGN